LRELLRERANRDLQVFLMDDRALMVQAAARIDELEREVALREPEGLTRPSGTAVLAMPAATREDAARSGSPNAISELANVVAKLRWAVESGEFSAMVKPAEAALLLKALEGPPRVTPATQVVRISPEEMEALVSDVSVIRHDGGTDGR
jgi:hypothetical protein